ncbi:peptidoglycan DD-metalloendopeptidase family protein [filamentous cyanobacterium LEGE 11480]|uniref:Peptidoglycan DD-metalloendopeptidase family protein n=1 Tax=Romeriopsis navalis LEGE 11480 TaxID=2777977 RepID=A0A928Z5A6_9CYAN|nr:peptidoglycan DD-metalloendopeptidase family protein [Romeriopsis navalis]MBE9031802.1 peptidoglycan DD-metalloendopeptidase family protein [Romeriopsis navalis LEGE 11480]
MNPTSLVIDMGLKFNEAAQRWQHTSGRKKGRFATEGEIPDNATPAPGRSIGANELESLLEQIRILSKRNNRILSDQEDRRGFVMFLASAAMSIGLANLSHGISDGLYSAHYNYKQAETFVKACSAKPWDCLWRKIPGPDFNPLVSPQGNVSAMLDLIAYAEGTNSAYNISYTGKRFSGYADHPRALYTANGISSDAAGRYQFLSTTWDKLARKHGLTDFSPANQDRAAIELMKECKGYGAAVRGDVPAFSNRCWNTWASIGSSSGQRLDKRQSTVPLKRLQAKYQEFQRDLNSGETPAKPLAKLTLTSPMNPKRLHPVTGETRPHNGADYACALGEIVRSPIAGKFSKGMPDPNGFGNTWGHITSQTDATIATIGHTRKLLVNDQQLVKKGQPIAECGSEGISSGPHLHLEIRRNGKLINPEEVLKP